MEINDDRVMLLQFFFSKYMYIKCILCVPMPMLSFTTVTHFQHFKSIALTLDDHVMTGGLLPDFLQIVWCQYQRWQCANIQFSPVTAEQISCGQVKMSYQYIDIYHLLWKRCSCSLDAHIVALLKCNYDIFWKH